jgi:hypothetical protein
LPTVAAVPNVSVHWVLSKDYQWYVEKVEAWASALWEILHFKKQFIFFSFSVNFLS